MLCFFNGALGSGTVEQTSADKVVRFPPFGTGWADGSEAEGWYWPPRLRRRQRLRPSVLEEEEEGLTGTLALISTLVWVGVSDCAPLYYYP